MLNRALGMVACAITSPIMAAVAVVVGVTQGPPIVFAQVRAGHHGRPFTLFKFRTMRAPRYHGEPDAERLSSVGRWLRATSLDELPSLWNVARGDMHLVGPRPLPVSYTARYSAEQARRLQVKPGVTGLVQTEGRNAMSWDEKFAWDVWYVEHRSWKLDLRILAETPAAVLSGRGVSHSGHATMPEFFGSDRT